MKIISQHFATQPHYGRKVTMIDDRGVVVANWIESNPTPYETEKEVSKEVGEAILRLLKKEPMKAHLKQSIGSHQT